eukprot:3014750-Alexandrium_andersonii.AAC.1
MMRRWHARKKELTHQRVSLVQRLRRLHGTVLETGLWGSWGWRLTAGSAKTLQTAELRLARKVLGLRRRPGEDH